MLFGLIGYPISQSFSRPYFTKKFGDLGLAATHEYRNFELQDISLFPEIIQVNPALRGLNVTIPHKQSVIEYLDELDPNAAAIGAVNTILIEGGKTKGFNTDVIGFREDFIDFTDYRSSNAVVSKGVSGPLRIEVYNEGGQLHPQRPKKSIDERALVLGTGGASLAISEAMHQLGIPVTSVSRSKAPGQLTYDQITADVINVHRYIIDCTPLGASYRIEEYPQLPYAAMSDKHYCYDLVYHPAETVFLRKAKAQGAQIRSGLGMLEGQAEAAWKIWTEA